MKRFPQDVLNQASKIHAALENGIHWSQIGGRRHNHSKHIVFNLKHWYRLVCWQTNQSSLRIKVMTHERYNTFASNTHR
ncbi:ParE family toxin-like protein [Acaryochloris marina NIES-2412]|uniref:ParE family toxin-like protein n=1 Tax=Acaryochloris marina TaxID=155978 RepID=UPI0040585DA9